MHTTHSQLAGTGARASEMSATNQLRGFGNEHESEALDDALPKRGNSPQQPAHGLITEGLSGTAFTAPRATNARTWLYRKRPSVRHLKNLTPHALPRFITAPDAEAAWLGPSRWFPADVAANLPADQHTEWLSSLTTVATNGNCHLQVGGAIHVYGFTRSAEPAPVFVNTDAEMIIVPRQGSLRLTTELGVLDVAPAEIAIIPRGIKFRTETLDDLASGWVSENYGQAFRLPDPGLIGLNSLALTRDFVYPSASAKATEAATTIVVKSTGRFASAKLDHSPLDVVAWRGNYAPCVYDLRLFSPIGSVLFDHPDPSINTVLTSPSDLEGTANIDFVVFRERWLVAEDTFRPPWFHSNTMSEFMGIIDGEYDAKPTSRPGTMTLHNQHMPHGPAASVHDAARQAALEPQRLAPTMAFMLESRYVWNPTQWAATSDTLDTAYADCWDGIGDDAF